MARERPDGKPKKMMTAYVIFKKGLQKELRKRHPEVLRPYAKFSKYCAKRWKNMPDDDKVFYRKDAKADKQRFDKELKAYLREQEGGEKQLREPKHPSSAFVWFCKDERPKLRKMNPEATMGDNSKELARMWAKADPETKERYILLSEKDKERYKKEKKEFRKAMKDAAIAAEAEVIDLVDDDE